MKPKHPNSRKSVLIPSTRWLAYATASAATTFAGANSAEATIHYSGRINQDFDGCRGDAASFPLAESGNFFRLRDSVEFCFTDYGGGAYFEVFGKARASFAGFYNSACPNHGAYSLSSVSRLKRGNLISNRAFLPGSQGGIIAIASRCSTGGNLWVGQFDGRGGGFIGFKFNNGSGDQYGWVRIKMQRGSNENQNFRLIDYAYGDIGDRIRAGQKSSEQPLANKGSLGLLAIGAAGLLLLRKRRSDKLEFKGKTDC